MYVEDRCSFTYRKNVTTGQVLLCAARETVDIHTQVASADAMKSLLICLGLFLGRDGFVVSY